MVTKAERREAWKTRTTATATALKKAGATVSRGGRRSVPLSATAVKPREEKSEIVKAVEEGKLPEALEKYESKGVEVKKLEKNIYEVTRGKETQYAYVSPEGKTIFTPTLHRAMAHKGFEPDTKPTHAEIASRSVETFTDKVIPSHKEPEYVPSPYKPGTRPEDVLHGTPKVPKPREETQIHEVLLERLEKLDVAAGKLWKKADETVKEHIPDIKRETFERMAASQHPIPGMGYRAFDPKFVPTESEIAKGKFIHEKYEEFKEAPVISTRDIGVEGAMLYTGGVAVGAVTKVGMLGARMGVGRGLGKVAARFPQHEMDKLVKPVIVEGKEVFRLPKVTSGHPIERATYKLPEIITKFKATPHKTIIKDGKPVIVSGHETKVGRAAETFLERYGFKEDPTLFRAGKLRHEVLTKADVAVEPAIGAAFAGVVVKDIAATPKEEIPKKLFEYSMGFAGAAKGYRAPERMFDVWRVRGRKEISLGDIAEPEVIMGKEAFPFMKKGETVPELITRFKHSEYKLPGETPEATHVWHATPGKMPPEFTVKAGTARPTDLPGIYTAPSVSTHFLRTGQVEVVQAPKMSYLKRMFGEKESLDPTVLRFEVPGMERIPPGMRGTVETSKAFILQQKTSKAIISRDVELTAAGHKGKVEAESLIPPGSDVKISGREYYVRIGDRKIPIDAYIAEPIIKGPRVAKDAQISGVTQPRVRTKDVPTEYKSEFIGGQRIRGVKIKDIPGFRARPESGYYIPKKPIGYKPYFRSVTAVTSIVPIIKKSYIPSVPSEHPPVPREYVPRIPDEYTPVIPDEYVPKIPDEYTPRIPDEYVPPTGDYTPRIPDEYVPPPSKYVPPPMPIPVQKPPKEKKKKLPRKGKKDHDGYVWNLANPIASLEEMMGGRQTVTIPKPRKK